jgi:acyl dehydratase
MTERMTDRSLDAPPSLGASYLRAVRRRRAASPAPAAERVWQRWTLAHQEVNLEQLQSYQKVCGFGVSDVLPTTFLHVLGFPLAMHVMTEPDFPFPLLGLIHLGNSVTQHRALRCDERYSFQTWAENLRAHPVGQQIDVRTVASAAGDVVWEETSTYLRRQAPAARASEPAAATSTQDRPTPEPASAPVIQWRVPADIGRRYAAVSGDRNPIHLYPLTARLLGFPAAIAHGMWLKARTIAALGPQLPAAVSIEVTFKTPVVLPATVELAAARGEPDTTRTTSRPTGEPQWSLRVHTVRTGKPNLIGAIRSAPS